MSLDVEPIDGGRPDEAASFLQSAFWGEFKSSFGWKPLRFKAGRDSVQLLVRSLGGGFCFAYVPHGPAMELAGGERAEGESAAYLAALSEELKPFLPRLCAFIRFDPPCYLSEEPRGGRAEGDGEDEAEAPRWSEGSRPTIGPPLRRAVSDVQPPDTVIVSLDRDEEAILAAMKSKWRYNIRLAEKKGVVVQSEGAGAIPEFYKLYRATSARDRIALHPEAYYARQFELAAACASRAAPGEPGFPDLRLWVARHEGQALAANITLFMNGKATYLYGASSDEKRNLMPTYALQWAAMRAAKAARCLEYDLYGMPPTDDPGHPMAGLYRFKTGFGGAIVHRPGSWDYPLLPAVYSAFRAAEAARKWYYKDFKKRAKRA